MNSATLPRHAMKAQLQSIHMLLRTASLLMLLALTLGAQKQPFDVQGLLKIARISEPQLSPDGQTVAFTVQTVDLDQNTKPKQIYTVPTTGGTPKQITTAGTDNERPQWAPDSNTSPSSPIAADLRKCGS